MVQHYMKQPKIGALVHYTPYNGDDNPWGAAPWPALIQSLDGDGTARLWVLAPQGPFMDFCVPQATKTGQLGTWTWPVEDVETVYSGSGITTGPQKKKLAKKRRKLLKQLAALDK